MKILIPLVFSICLLSCKSKNETPDFITNEEQKINEYADKALEEAQELLDSLEQTPILNTDI